MCLHFIKPTQERANKQSSLVSINIGYTVGLLIANVYVNAVIIDGGYCDQFLDSISKFDKLITLFDNHCVYLNDVP